MNICLMDNRNVVAVVKDLIQAVRDDQEGYRLAAEAVPQRDVKLLFVHYAHQRADFFEELHRLEQAYGNGSYGDREFSFELHDGWLSLRDAICTHDAKAILSACECGECNAMNHYRKALSQDLPLDVQMVIGAQSLEVKAARDKVRYLRDHALAC